MQRWLFGFLVVGGMMAGGHSVAQPLELKVMTFNVRYGTADDGTNRWAVRKPLLCGLVAREAPDALGLQEALRAQLDDIRAAVPGYGEAGEGRDGGRKGEYSAILYREARFRLEASGTFWLSDTPDAPSTHWGNKLKRICTWARLVEKESGLAFYLFNTHLDNECQPAREKSVRLIAERIGSRPQPDPFVLTGDFNAGEDNPAVRFLTGAPGVPAASPAPMADTFRVLYPDEKSVGTFNGFKGLTGGPKIDYILAAPGAAVLSADILRTAAPGPYPSDHFPVTARLRLESPPAQTK